MKAENYAKLCEACKAIVRKEDTDNRRRYRIKIRELDSKAEKVRIKRKGDN